MDRKTYDRLVEALAIGRWPDGRGLTDDQRQSAMQAVITWGELHLAREERVGFIDKGSKEKAARDDPTPLNWKEPLGD
jgi:uncharacterized protein YeaC (DUF1315 family)